jgi:hypothetical protein
MGALDSLVQPPTVAVLTPVRLIAPVSPPMAMTANPLPHRGFEG